MVDDSKAVVDQRPVKKKWHADERRSPLWIGVATDASDGANGRCVLWERVKLIPVMWLIHSHVIQSIKLKDLATIIVWVSN